MRGRPTIPPPILSLNEEKASRRKLQKQISDLAGYSSLPTWPILFFAIGALLIIASIQ